MFWFNEDIWGFTYGMEEDMFKEGVPTPKCQAFTMLFNIFIWLHIFNMLNCREINENKTNVLSGLYKNKLFFLMVLAIAGFQFVMVQYGGVLARTSGLTDKQHSYSILIGSTALIPSYIIKKLPDRFTKILVIPLNDSEIKEVKPDRFTNIINKAQNYKATDVIKKV
jgi:magnesium-transporting ATPase (P-type)